MTEWQDIWGRKMLPFPFSYLKSVVTDQNEEFQQGSPVYTGDDLFIIRLTTEQRLRLTSALDLGAMIAYPTDYQNVIYPLLQALEFPNGAPDMSKELFCSIMSQCLSDAADGNNVTLLNAFQEALEASGVSGFGDTDAPLGINGSENLASDIAGCDLDQVYGSIVDVIEYIEIIARDSVERTTSETLDKAQILNLIDWIPGLGDLPVVDDLAEYTAYIVDQSLTSFDAGISQARNEQIACYIFDRACSTCEITTDLILDAYADVIGLNNIAQSTVASLINAVTGFGNNNERFAYGICAVVAGALAVGGEAGGFVGLRSIKSIIKSAQSNSAWQGLCNPCEAAWSRTWDITQSSQAGWNVVKGFFATPTGLYSQTPPPTQASLDRTFAQAITGAETVVVESRWDGINRSGQLYRLILDSNGSEVASIDLPLTLSGTYTFDVTGIPSFDYARVVARASSGSGGSITIDSIQMNGFGGFIPT